MGGLSAVRRRHVLLVAPFVALGWSVSRVIGDNSFLWHVRAGTVQLDAGEVLRADPFSFLTNGDPWRTQSWLAELAYGLAERVTGGVTGWVPLLLLAALGSTGWLVVSRGSRLGLGTGWLVILGALFVYQTFVFTVPRPVLFSYPLLGAVLLMVDRDDAELWAIPPLMWIWAALHGSFVLGLGVIGLDALRRGHPKRWIVLAASTIAVSLTAHGASIWGILVGFVGNRDALARIEEWQRPEITDLAVLPFMLIAAAAIALVARRSFSVGELIMVVPFMVFGFLAARNVMPAFIVAAPIVMSAAVRTQRSRAPASRGEIPIANAVLVTLLVTLMVVGALQPTRLNEERFPSRAVTAALGEGRVFHDTAVGGYLIWLAGPRLQVYVDDRAELFGAEGFDQMSDVRAGRDAIQTLDELDVEQVIAGREWPLLEALRASSWVEVAADEFFVLMARPVD